jgi:rod shape determining protein RodA
MGKQICIGVSAYLVFQIFVNVGVATNLLPNTGLPLPFISYGLTSLVSSMIAVGLVLNVGVRKK